MARATTPDFLVVGVLTFDVTPEPGNPHGRIRPGGAAAFAARCASNLGLTVGVVASADADYPVSEVLPGIDVHLVVSDFTTFFQNVYAPTGERTQVLGARSRSITREDIPDGWANAPLVLLGPLVREVPPRAIEWFPRSAVAATVQGWLREWDQYGRVTESSGPPVDLPDSARRKYDLLTGSSAELDGVDENRLSDWLQCGRVLGVTDGENGSDVVTDTKRTHVPAYATVESDPTGAGDVWTTAFLVRLAETDDPLEAALFANAAGSLTVEREGLAGIPDRAGIQDRMERGQEPDQ